MCYCCFNVPPVDCHVSALFLFLIKTHIYMLPKYGYKPIFDLCFSNTHFSIFIPINKLKTFTHHNQVAFNPNFIVMGKDKNQNFKDHHQHHQRWDEHEHNDHEHEQHPCSSIEEASTISNLSSSLTCSSSSSFDTADDASSANSSRSSLYDLSDLMSHLPIK